MIAGEELIVDALGCRPDRLDCLWPAQRICELLLNDLELRVVGSPQWHQFPSPGGVTGMYLLTESHLTCHTFPEWGLATWNLYCCRPRAAWSWERHLGEWLGAGEISIRRLNRGGPCSAPGVMPAGATPAGAMLAGIAEREWPAP